MKIELKNIKIKDLVKGYTYRDEEGNVVPKEDGNQEFGVVGYGGKLDIRPPYQREFVYKDKQRNRVIDSILKGFPLNVMYWADIGNGQYEIMDGQQRTMSICEYASNNFSVEVQAYQSMAPDSLIYSQLPKDKKEQFLNYELLVYVCEGTDEEKLDWFNIVNIAGEQLTEQELRNAVYTGPWLIDAKTYFSKTNCPAHGKYSSYLRGASIRQEYLETVLKWAAHKEGLTIEDYMAKHRDDKNASELWQYFEEVMSWVTRTFPNYRKEMKGIEWGILYNNYGDVKLNAQDTEDEIKKLMMDDDVTKKKGIYEYILSGDEKHLNIRAFTASMKRKAYEEQDGICPICNEKFSIGQMEADHIDPWSEGGKTELKNLQMLCKSCNRRKGNK